MTFFKLDDELYIVVMIPLTVCVLVVWLVWLKWKVRMAVKATLKGSKLPEYGSESRAETV